MSSERLRAEINEMHSNPESFKEKLAEFEDDTQLCDGIVLLNPYQRSSRKDSVEAEPNMLDRLLGKLTNTLGNKMKIKFKGNTTQADFDLFNRLDDNIYRAKSQIIKKEKIGLTKSGIKTVTELSFILGKFKNRNPDGQNIIVDPYDTDEPKQVAAIITVQNGDVLNVQINWHVEPSTILKEWHPAFDIDSEPLMHPPKQKTPWESKNMTESEFKQKRIDSRLQDIRETNPDQFMKLLDLVESGKLDSLLKLAESL